MRRAERRLCDALILGLARHSTFKQALEAQFSYVLPQVLMEGAGDDGAVKSEQQVEFWVHFFTWLAGFFCGCPLIEQEAFQRLKMRNLAWSGR